MLINNAGAAWGAAFDDYPSHAWFKLYSINVQGAARASSRVRAQAHAAPAIFELTRALKAKLERGGSRAAPASVINIGSIDGIRVSSVPHFAYSTSKAAVHQLTRKLAFDFADEGAPITVNAIAAGAFVTDMMKGTVAQMGGTDALSRTIPLGRPGSPADIAGLVLYLASPAAAWMTGSIITLDGGVLASPTGPNM